MFFTTRAKLFAVHLGTAKTINPVQIAPALLLMQTILLVERSIKPFWAILFFKLRTTLSFHWVSLKIIENY